MSTNLLRKGPATAVLVCVAVVAAGCGSSSSSSKTVSPAASPTTTAATTATGAPATTGAPSVSAAPATAAGSSGAAATGDPILIGSLASLTNPAYSTPQNKDAINAAVSSINAAGGVKGHPLKIDFCDSAYDPNKELSCTRSLLAEHVSALVAPSILADSSGREFTLAEAASTAAVGTEGLLPGELNSKVAFPLSSGLPGWIYGAAKDLSTQGVTKVSIITTADPGSQFAAGLAAAALKQFGVAVNQTVTADAKTDPTLAGAVAKATGGGVDGLLLAPAPVIIPKLVGAIKQSGFTGKTASITALFAPALIKASGAAADGILLTSQVAFTTDTANPGIAAFLADMQKYAPNATIDESTLFAWAATQLFAKVAATASGTDAASILAAFSNLSTPVDVGVAAPYSVVGKTSPFPMFARIFNSTVQFGTISGGAVQSDGKGFVPAFTK